MYAFNNTKIYCRKVVQKGWPVKSLARELVFCDWAGETCKPSALRKCLLSLQVLFLGYECVGNTEPSVQSRHSDWAGV